MRVSRVRLKIKVMMFALIVAASAGSWKTCLLLVPRSHQDDDRRRELRPAGLPRGTP